MDEQGEAGNVITALCSFFIPGLGQLAQGRVFMALIMSLTAAVLWWILSGWIPHIRSIGPWHFRTHHSLPD